MYDKNIRQKGIEIRRLEIVIVVIIQAFNVVEFIALLLHGGAAFP